MELSRPRPKIPMLPSILVKSKTNKRKKRVHFTPSPEAKQGRKRPASFEPDYPSPSFPSKFPRTQLNGIPPRVQRIIDQTLSKAATLPPPSVHKSNTAGRTGAPTKTPATTTISGQLATAFDLPSKPIYPFDKETDWFTSMHAYVSCKARPMHVIGIKSDKTRRQCEGVESLDERLLKGEVDVVFHQHSEHEPVCETCWTMETHPHMMQDKKIWRDAMRMPGSWPVEKAEGPPHSHTYLVVYTGCRLQKNGENRPSYVHALRVMKGIEGLDGKTTYCRDKCSDRSKLSPTELRVSAIRKRTEMAIKDTKGQERLAVPRFEEKVYMPAFAGCPACDGKELPGLVKEMDEVGKMSISDAETLKSRKKRSHVYG
ncbi:hypothetical protein Dda_6284 [Drechslerella dactyloides]|uniref:Uncharacterized protein n=1 Tax=Drechslerella dactyloides TaxID=74499 RepID=A0AAD6IVB0_DREDA|nr:hypothetical protein Dda_6284 [Drechslerella dactyloides]